MSAKCCIYFIIRISSKNEFNLILNNNNIIYAIDSLQRSSPFFCEIAVATCNVYG